MGQEFSSNVSDFLMLHVVLNGIVVVDTIQLTQFHEVYTDAIVSEGLPMDIADSPAHLQKLLVLRDGFFEFTKVVVKDTG